MNMTSDPKNHNGNRYENIPRIITEIPGTRSRKILESQGKLETNTVVYPASFPIAIRRADGSVIEDVDGNLFIDWFTGISVLNFGFSDIIRKAVKDQMDLIWHALEIPTEIRIEFLKAFRSSFPQEMRDYKTVFGISGADACETAINMAHTMSGKGAPTIAFEGAYHGISGGVIAATSGKKYKESFYGSGFDVIRVPYPYSVWDGTDVESIMRLLRKIMTDPESGYGTPDSLIVEPIQGEGGYIVPPSGFLRQLREFCDDYGIIMIVDEVQTGMGRTGKMWAFEWDSIAPDIVCSSKSVGGGIPMSVVYYRSEYDERLPTPFHMGTFRANPLAMAAGTALLKKIPDVLGDIRRRGEKLLDEFRDIRSEKIRDVRGRGFMIGIELSDGRDSPMDAKKVLSIKHDLLKNGLMMHTCGHYSNVFRYMGALNIPDELNARGLDIFRKSITAL